MKAVIKKFIHLDYIEISLIELFVEIFEIDKIDIIDSQKRPF